MTHDLKCVPPYFSMVRSGLKTFEVRKRDRAFIAGDKLLLREWIDDQQAYTGEVCLVDVTFVLNGGRFGIDPEYCVMSVRLAKQEGGEG